MTGQGNTRHEQIKNSNQQKREQRALAMDITKELRTAIGQPVRALKFKTRQQRMFIFGKLANTGNMERCITGQVWMPLGNAPKQWREVTWKENGEHDINEDLNLVEYKAPVISNADLFSLSQDIKRDLNQTPYHYE